MYFIIFIRIVLTNVLQVELDEYWNVLHDVIVHRVMMFKPTNNDVNYTYSFLESISSQQEHSALYLLYSIDNSSKDAKIQSRLQCKCITSNVGKLGCDSMLGHPEFWATFSYFGHNRFPSRLGRTFLGPD